MFPFTKISTLQTLVVVKYSFLDTSIIWLYQFNFYVWKTLNIAKTFALIYIGIRANNSQLKRRFPMRVSKCQPFSLKIRKRYLNQYISIFFPLKSVIEISISKFIFLFKRFWRCDQSQEQNSMLHFRFLFPISQEIENGNSKADFFHKFESLKMFQVCAKFQFNVAVGLWRCHLQRIF